MKAWRYLFLSLIVVLGFGMPAATLAARGDQLPPAPTQVQAHAAADGSVTVTWMAPVEPGAPVTGYRIRVYFSVLETVVKQQEVTGNVTRAVVTGLPAGQTYRFAVQAVNKFGTGAESLSTAPVMVHVVPPPAASPPPTLKGAPGKPSSLCIHGATGQTVMVAWAAAPAGGFSIGSYQVIARQLTSSGWQVVTDAQVGFYLPTLAVVSNLHSGTIYSFTVRAANAVGWGPESDASKPLALGLPAPASALSLTATGGNGAITLTWSNPSGVTVDHHLLLISLSNGTPVSFVDGIHTASMTVSGLTNGASYHFALYTIDTSGTASAPAQTDAAPGVPAAQVPTAPINVDAHATSAAAVVTWTAPFAGGTPITSYVVTAYAEYSATVAATATVAGSLTSATITGLTNGRTYTFAVYAVNAAGRGPESVRSSALTLASTPGAPGNVRVTPGSESVFVRWDSPVSDGGKPLTGYQVTASDGVHAPLLVATTSTSVTLTGLANGVTYTITVSAVNALGAGSGASATARPFNGEPALTLPGNQSVHYSDRLSFTVSARDPEPADHLTLTASGLPPGLTFVDNGNGTGTVSGAVQAVPSTYTVTFSANDGHNPPVTQTLTITVTPEVMTVQPSGPATVKLQGSEQMTTKVTVRAAIHEADQDSVGDVDHVTSVEYTLKPMGLGVTYHQRATVTRQGNTLLTSATFRYLQTNVYRVIITVGGGYYEGTGNSLFTVYNAAARGFTKGEGDVISADGPGYFNVTAQYSKAGKLTGTMVFNGQHKTGNFTLRGKVTALVVKGSQAYLQGQGTMNGVGSYRFALAIFDNSSSNKFDKVALWVIDPSNVLVGHCTFSATPVQGGHFTVRAAG